MNRFFAIDKDVGEIVSNYCCNMGITLRETEPKDLINDDQWERIVGWNRPKNNIVLHCEDFIVSEVHHFNDKKRKRFLGFRGAF